MVVAGERYGGSEGRSKKQAEQRAAAAAWRILTERTAEPNGALLDKAEEQAVQEPDEGEADR